MIEFNIFGLEMHVYIHRLNVNLNLSGMSFLNLNFSFY